MANGLIGVKLRCSTWEQLASLYQSDLANGTLSLRSNRPPPVGTALRIELVLPSGSVATLEGRVARQVEEVSGGRGPGVEVALDGTPASTLTMIESALAETAAAASLNDRRAARPPVPAPPPVPLARAPEGSHAVRMPAVARGTTRQVPAPPPAAAATASPAPSDTARSPAVGLSAASLFGDLDDEPAAEAAPLHVGATVIPPGVAPLLEEDRLAEALAVCDQLLRARPTDRAARATRSLVQGLQLMAAGDAQGAAVRLRAALEIDPTNERATQALTTCQASTEPHHRGLFGRLLGKK